MTVYCPVCAEPSVESERKDFERVTHACPNGHEWTVIDERQDELQALVDEWETWVEEKRAMGGDERAIKEVEKCAEDLKEVIDA